MLKEFIEVGELVEVDLKTGVGPFRGKVLATGYTSGTYEFTWYHVEPENRDEMPGAFWYKDTEVKRVRQESE